MATTGKLTIHEEGKIDIHSRQDRFQRALLTLEKDTSLNKENKELIFHFLRDCKLGKTVLGKSKKKIGPARCLKYLGILRQLSVWFEKPFDCIGQEDMESFIERLEADSIKSQAGKSYSESTKADIKKTIKKFWKWKDGQNRAYPDLVAWIDTYEPVKDVPALSRSEVEKMIEQTANPRDKALLMVLFDSGARIEELLNVRLKREHLFWKEEVGCYMIRLEYSKTKPRTISLPLSTEYINSWLEIHPAREDPRVQFFPLAYANLRKVIHRIGKRVLDKRVSPHLLRHSSATFYANSLKNRYQLCYRYGWAMSSDMVDRYLDREGIFEQETAAAVRSSETLKVNRESLVLKEELALVRESHIELTQRFEKLQDEHQELLNGKGFMKLLTSVIKQHRNGKEMLEIMSGEKFDIVLGSSVNQAARTKCSD